MFTVARELRRASAKCAQTVVVSYLLVVGRFQVGGDESHFLQLRGLPVHAPPAGEGELQMRVVNPSQSQLRMTTKAEEYLAKPQDYCSA
jgi:hypothetical protein